MARNNLFNTSTLASRAELGPEFIRVPLTRAQDTGRNPGVRQTINTDAPGETQVQNFFIVTRAGIRTQGHVNPVDIWQQLFRIPRTGVDSVARRPVETMMLVIRWAEEWFLGYFECETEPGSPGQAGRES